MLRNISRAVRTFSSIPRPPGRRKSGRQRIPQFFLYGLPLLILVTAGSFGLAEFTEIRVKKRDEKNRKLTAEESLRYQKKRETPVSLEEAFEEVQRDIDISTWENKRGPRPWEEMKVDANEGRT